MENIYHSMGQVPRPSVAIVECDSAAAIDLRHKLEHSGYMITGVYCEGLEAVNNIPETEPDVILIDISSNESSEGIKTAENITLTQSTPVVFITGGIHQIDVSGMSFITNYTILVKPFTEHDLIYAVETVYKSFVKSVNFYRECRSLILEINPYKIDFTKKLDYLINKLSELEGVGDYEKAKFLLTEIRSHFKPYANAEEPVRLTDKKLERSIHQIIDYTDYLLEKFDGLDNEEIKNCISRISIYLKVLFDFNHGGNIST